MAMRFVPPPGWRTPPGFTPTDDWHPDPSWPAAPAGWTYWVDDAVPPPSPPAGVPKRRSLRESHPVVATTRPDAAASGVMDPHPVVGSTMVLPGLAQAVAEAAPETARPRSGVVRVGPPPRTSPAEAATGTPLGPLSLPGADEDDAEEGRGRRWLVPAAFGLAGLAVGLLVGIGLTLSSQSEAEEAKAAADRAQTEVADERVQLDQERTELDTQQQDIDDANDKLDERETAVEGRESDVQQAEDDADARSTELDERESQQQDKEKDKEKDKKKDDQGGNDDGGSWWDWG